MTDVHGVSQKWLNDTKVITKQRFRDIMKIYQHRVFVDDSQLFYWYNSQMEQIDQSTFIICQESDFHRSKILLENLIFRVPIYYGNPVNVFNSINVKKTLGYDPLKDTPRDLCRFVIVGTTPMIYRNGVPGTIDVIHAFGINLESTETDDYHLFMNNDHLNIKKYRQTLYLILKMIITAANKIHNRQRLLGDTRLINVRLPMIGLGAFLSTVSSKEYEEVIQAFGETLSEVVANNNNKEIQFTICIYDKDSSLTKHIKENFHLKVGLGDEYGNLFNITPDNSHHVLVNAWDSRSFIGNGLIHDPTIDGLLVSGAGGILNASYLHNPFFSTSLLNSNKWICSE